MYMITQQDDIHFLGTLRRIHRGIIWKKVTVCDDVFIRTNVK